MKVVNVLSEANRQEIIQRPVIDTTQLYNLVQPVLNAVRQDGDAAIRKFTREFDKVELEDFRVPQDVIEAAADELSPELKKAIGQAAANIRSFHEQQVTREEAIETMPGVKCWRKSVGIEKVGLYIPGGSAPLFSTILMLGIPAAIAGCKEVVLCSPPGKDGRLNPAILYAAQLTGITKVFAVGGVQAIAAMAFGTETVPQVYKIFGPGNQYVTCAKQLVQQQGIAIDMPAGPSEVCILADDTADAEFVAADLLSQAEHGADSQVLLVSVSKTLVEKVQQALEEQLADLPRKEIAARALENSKAVIATSYEEAMNLVNEYAAEHLIISCKDDEALAVQVINAGSVFLGNYSPESAGDYASGTNHTLPTNGFAKAYSGVSVDAFVKKITYQKLTREGLRAIGNTVEQMAEAEGLQAHKKAVSIRLRKIN
ncbi:histidinol dehydrogenase [Sediminibacterium ginsengisoli]|uniref:Histidinol dehydrogenase n=1 Tax=Sediminibacterium ginsengisoli TaxID=413434 RepID=A0A1T4L225_9BACT|nr:histidinol dehydrogenase [Sediminibacterium ginsengisoli]SJZ48755.1 histidinol dehydrogenase [Sediminibacterium ginsengisoli]